MSNQRTPKQPNGGKHEGFSKYLHRMRTVFRKASSSRSGSVPRSQETSGGSGSEPSKPVPPKATTLSKATVMPKETPAPATEIAPNSVPEPTVFKHWGAIQEEKTRALFAKYGLTPEPGEWRSHNDMAVQRVAKPIRMRVRRTCHRCQTTFGPDKLCTNCQHVRCKKCPRYPAAKTHDQTATALHTILAQKDKNPTGTQRKVKEPPLTLPSRTGGQDLVRKQIKQRVRRTCHRCCTTFAPGATECNSCKHTRCKKCPRDPPKLHKYPDGYPGDAEPPEEPPARTWRKPRMRVRYSCHQCSTLYLPGQMICSDCGQEKGAETIRDPPKKPKPEPDPEVVRRVEERLAKLTISAG
ncbi:hypothetical protein BDV28DRAFT_159628 [Aspergillus coremiiformis]|uniref:Uncharacterized protein n=1 Tax=Aspergillus coremiiformis TaxID=138285 RepID=A0A5N6YY81_9EURO|nr:hypothetical protein BDV28DRAFT_159628 [Aspergillus coremiiformis]